MNYEVGLIRSEGFADILNKEQSGRLSSVVMISFKMVWMPDVLSFGQRIFTLAQILMVRIIIMSFLHIWLETQFNF